MNDVFRDFVITLVVSSQTKMALFESTDRAACTAQAEGRSCDQIYLSFIALHFLATTFDVYNMKWAPIRLGAKNVSDKDTISAHAGQASEMSPVQTQRGGFLTRR